MPSIAAMDAILRLPWAPLPCYPSGCGAERARSPRSPRTPRGSIRGEAMVRDYAEAKALEALLQAEGDKRRAARILEGWAEEDGRLKNALVRPFFANLCGFAVQRAAARAASGPAKAKPAKTGARPALDAVIQALGGGKRVAVVDPGPASPA